MINLATEDDPLKKIVKTRNCFMNYSFSALIPKLNKVFFIDFGVYKKEKETIRVVDFFFNI